MTIINSRSGVAWAEPRRKRAEAKAPKTVISKPCQRGAHDHCFNKHCVCDCHKAMPQTRT